MCMNLVTHYSLLVHIIIIDIYSRLYKHVQITSLNIMVNTLHPVLAKITHIFQHNQIIQPYINHFIFSRLCNLYFKQG